jgi:hypothetical protein
MKAALQLAKAFIIKLVLVSLGSSFLDGAVMNTIML